MRRAQRLVGVFIVLVMLLASMGNAAMAQDQGNQSGTSTQSGGGNVPPPMNNPAPEPEPEPEYVEPEPEYVEPEPEYVEPEPEYTEPEAEPEYVEPASDQQVQQAAPARGTRSGSQSGASSSRGAQAPNRPAPPPAPTPTPRPQNPPPSTGGGSGGSGEFWILVDKSDHMLYAFRGNTQVFRAINNLGRPGYDTPTGTFWINSKYRYEDMNTYGYLADVPYTMYFTNRGHAIHGTYWTSVNGRNVSHGCVNLSVGDAATLYGMTPIGTRVVIRW